MELYEFAKNHLKIKTRDGNRALNELELAEILEYQKMTESGHSLVFVKGRGPSRLFWVKNQN
jgi:hypothetical protein